MTHCMSRHWSYVVSCISRCMPGNEESFCLRYIHQIYLSMGAPKSVSPSCILSVLSMVLQMSNLVNSTYYFMFVGIPQHFLNWWDVKWIPKGLWHLKAKVSCPETKAQTSCRFVAMCNKGLLEMNCGSRPGQLCLVEPFDVWGDKSFKGEHFLSIVEREKKIFCTIRMSQTQTQSACQASEHICSLYVFCIHGFSISWSALMASSFNFNHVSITANSMHMKFVT